MRRWTSGVLVAGLLAVLVAAPASAEAPAHDVSFPPDWILKPVDEPLADGPARLLMRAYPDAQSEECVVADLGPAAKALDALGVTNPQTYNRVAADLLGRGDALVTTFGLGYSNPWSAFLEAELAGDTAFSMYSYQRDGAWLVLECSSDSMFHQDWEQIAKTFAWID